MRNTWCHLIVIAGVVIAPPDTWAQAPPPAETEATQSAAATESSERGKRGWLKTISGLFDEGQTKPVRPIVGVVVPGSGVSGGVAVEHPNIGMFGIGVGGDAEISVRNYQRATARIGLLNARRRLSGLRPADSAITSFSDVRQSDASGLAIYIEHRYSRLPGLNLFGTGSNGQYVRSDFGETTSTTDLVVQWQGDAPIGLSARVGRLAADLFPGTNDGLANVEDAFGPELVNRIDEARYLVAGVGVAIDRRDGTARPIGGGLLSVAVWRFESRTEPEPSFSRLSFDAQQYRTVGTPRHVLAARLLGSFDVKPDGVAIPFYLMQSLGGSRSMRSLRSYRLRGARLLETSIESRWMVLSKLEIAPFVDASHVTDAPVPPGARRVMVSSGIGARVRLKDRVVLRTDIATGREGTRLVFALDSPF